MTGAAVAARARAAVGSRFRLHGRDPASGLDCVGVVGWATDRVVPSGYALRGGSAAVVSEVAGKFGFMPAEGAAPGDVLLLASGPGQLHLAVRTDDGFVHADAALRRVVERPGTPPWPLLAAWRVEGD